jgi:alpha-methylacyl-CoA racemase
VAGPLDGMTIIELAGIGPGPFAGMMLADMGAEVIRVDRPGGNPMATLGHDVLFRNRRCLAVDLKSPEGVEVVLRLVTSADALFEGFRPGVAERLGLGPDTCLERNPALVYGRMTGWGQDGPLAPRAGHDINYIALSGALYHSGRAGHPPTPALNLTGDFGGGGMMLAYGIVCGLLEAQRSGQGQVIDAAMIDGSAAMMAMFFSMQAAGLLRPDRGTNMLDTGAHFYDAYETADGQWISIGSIEPQFYALLREHLGLTDDIFDQQINADLWPAMKDRIAEVVRSKTRDEWDAILAETDVCYAPVLSLAEAPSHPHNVARGTFIEVNGIAQAAPAPRFSRTAPDTPVPQAAAGAHTSHILADHGFATTEIDTLLASGAVAQAD